MSRKVKVYIAASIDGYIAGPDNDMSFLDIETPEGEDYGYGAFIAEIDTVLVGRTTYNWVMTQLDTFPHAHIESYVITSEKRESEGKIHFYTGDPCVLVRDLKKKPGKNIFVDGGSRLIQSLMQEKLIDTYMITYIPVLLGKGTPLFRTPLPHEMLTLVSARSFSNGLVQLQYVLT